MGDLLMPKDHEIAQAINELRDIAIEFHDTQQLRERIARVVLELVKKPPTDYDEGY
jgi:outer membrane PBP1 activator LpoA protein